MKWIMNFQSWRGDSYSKSRSSFGISFYTQVNDSNAQVDETEGDKVDDIVNGMDKLSLTDSEEPSLEEETKKTPQVHR